MEFDDINTIADEPFFTPAFGKAIAQTLIISAASTAGMFVGMIAVGAGIDWVQKRNAAKALKNAETTETPAN